MEDEQGRSSVLNPFRGLLHIEGCEDSGIESLEEFGFVDIVSGCLMRKGVPVNVDSPAFVSFYASTGRGDLLHSVIGRF